MGLREGKTVARVFFIVNPAAGHGRARKHWDSVAPLAATLGDSTVRFTERPFHAAELAREAAEAGFDRIAVLGGDGTINEAGNGLVGTGAALAVVPAGTANDWVRSFPIPKKVDDAVRLAFSGRPKPLDVGLVKGAGVSRYFLNMVGAGFDAEVAGRTNDLGSWLKVAGGTLPTLVSLVLTLFAYRHPTVTIKLDGKTVEVPRLVLSAMGVCRFIGGGMMLLPEAIPDDGLFDVMWAHDFGRLELLSVVAKTYRGKHVGHPRIHFARASQVEVASSIPLRWHVDGEVGGHLPITVETVRGAISVIVP